MFDWAGYVSISKVAKPYINTGAVIAEGDKNENANFHFIYICEKHGVVPEANKSDEDNWNLKLRIINFHSKCISKIRLNSLNIIL